MPASPPPPAYPPSEAGYWDVKISRVWENAGAYYNPGMDRIAVNEALLNTMLAETGLVTNVVASE